MLCTGIEATRDLRAMEAANRYSGRLYIVAVSANARQSYADLAMAAGMDGFVSKPYAAASIKAEID